MRNFVLAAAIAALSLPGAAVAHEAGQVVFRAGIIHAAPDVKSSKIKLGGAGIPGTSADVKSDTQLGMTATYMVMPRFGIELLAATPFTHEVRLKGAGLGGKFGEVSHLPPTVSAQFFFLNPKSKFQPYVGLGLTYTMFFSEKLTQQRKDAGFSDFSMDNSIGISPQVGMDFAIGDRLILNAAIWKLGMSSTANARLNGERVKIDLDIDPWVYFFGVGFKF